MECFAQILRMTATHVIVGFTAEDQTWGKKTLKQEESEVREVKDWQIINMEEMHTVSVGLFFLVWPLSSNQGKS